jgi:hypothetical protein
MDAGKVLKRVVQTMILDTCKQTENVDRGIFPHIKLLTSLCSLTDSCLGAVRRLDQGSMGAFLEGSASMSLATIVLDTGMRVFRVSYHRVTRARIEKVESDRH